MGQERSGKRPELELPGHEILRVLIGSQAHGTATEDSDRDERSVFIMPTDEFFKVDGRGSKKTIWVENKKTGEDHTGWELGHFMKMAINCNPTILEVLWAPVLNATNIGGYLTNLRQDFLSRGRIRDAFGGYAHNQRKKMMDEPRVGWTPRNWKFAEAYIRVLHQGIVLLNEGELPVKIHAQYARFLMEIKAGEVPLGKIVDIARGMDQELESAHNKSKLPDEPNIERINNWLIAVRKDYWE